MILEKSRTLFFAAAFLSLIPLQAFAASPVIGTERARGLRTLETAPMLFEYHRQTVGDERQFFTYPCSAMREILPASRISKPFVRGNSRSSRLRRVSSAVSITAAGNISTT